MFVSVLSGGLPIDMKNAIATTANITAISSAGMKLAKTGEKPCGRSGDMTVVFDSGHPATDLVARGGLAAHHAHQAPVEQDRDPVGILQEIVEILRHPQY